MSERKGSRILSRLASLEGLGFRRQRAIPYVQQRSNIDCGAACLAMVLQYFGKEVGLETVREHARTGSGGSSALGLLEAGRRLGLRGRGVRVEQVEDVRFLRPGTILHWKFRHFVVFEAHKKGKYILVDPAAGRRTVGEREFSQSFTGIAVELEPGSDFVEENRSRKALNHYIELLKGHRTTIGRILIASFFLQALTLALPLLTGAVVDRVLPRSEYALLVILSIGLAVVIVFRFIFSVMRGFLVLHLATRFDARATVDFFEHLLSLPFRFFTLRSTGDLVLRVESNTSIREILAGTTISVILDGSTACVYLLVLLALDLRFGAVALLLAAFRVAVFFTTRKAVRQKMVDVLQATANSRGYQVQVLAGIETLKTAGSEHHTADRWAQFFVKELNARLRQGRLDAWVQAVLDALTAASPMVLLLVGSLLVMRDDMSLGTMLAMTALASAVLVPLSMLVNSARELQLLSGYLERIDDVLETDPEQPRSDSRPRPTLEGSVAVENVSFSYEPESPPAVDNVSFTLDPGDFIALVGPSGSGKSTLSRLLTGLYPPSTGQIRFDGHRIEHLDLEHFRQQIGSVIQSSYIFGAPIRDNISFNAPGAPLGDVVTAAKLAEIHDDIIALPMGYDTVLADGGASLSGGQQQRIALARCLFTRPRVLILDEATSALDAVTELKVQRNLERLDVTRIVIAHRLSTIANADRILVIDRGKIVQSGNHQELLSVAGLYRDLVSGADDDSETSP